jgi:hypothetical protein
LFQPLRGIFSADLSKGSTNFSQTSENATRDRETSTDKILKVIAVLGSNQQNYLKRQIQQKLAMTSISKDALAPKILPGCKRKLRTPMLMKIGCIWFGKPTTFKTLMF